MASLNESSIEEALLMETEGESSESERFSDSDSSLDENEMNATCFPNDSVSDQFVWEDMKNYKGQREVFCGEHGPQGEARNSLNIISLFKLFFDLELISIIVRETNRYAEQYMKKCGMLFSKRSRVWDWKPVSADDIYIVLAIFMLMGIVQKPTLRSYFSKNATIRTPIFSSIISLDRFESICKFFHFVNNEVQTLFEGPKKLFKIYPVLVHLNDKFKKFYIPGQNISIDESLTLWKGRLSFRQYIPLKAAKFGIKTFELCESSTGYLWSFIIYTGKDTIISSPLSESLNNKTSELVMQLVNPLLGKGYTLWMDNYYNSPLLVAVLKKHRTDCVGTLRLNRKK